MINRLPVCGFPLSMVAVVFCAVLSVVFISAPALASVPVLYAFNNITLNDPTSAATGEAQIVVEVFNGDGTVKFKFKNLGPEESSISEVYFDDGTLLGISSIIDLPPDVDFVLGASPSNLPGGDLMNPPFEVTQSFLSEAAPPPAKKGVDPSEEVTIVFDLQSGGTLDDVLSELADGTLRIGIHVINFAGGYSEGFVNEPEGTPIPEPTMLTMLGLGTVVLLRRRRQA